MAKKDATASRRSNDKDATKPTRRPKDRRTTIEMVAAELFAEKGYAGTGVGEIAERVGVTPGAIYRHFSSKDDILRSIVLSSLDAFIAAIDVPDDAGTESRLTEQVRTAVTLTLAQPARVAIPLRERYSLTEAARQELAAKGRHLAGVWADAIRNANPTVSAADAALRLRIVNGVLSSVARRPGSVDPARVHDLFTGSLVAMLLARASRYPASAEPVRRSEWSPPRLRRQEIRDISAQLFRMYGYNGVGMDEIGTTAGISGPTVYGTYASKSDILVDACDYAVAKFGLAVEEAIGSAKSADHALQRILRSCTATFFDNADIMAVLNHETDALPERDRIRINRHRSDYYNACYAVLRKVRPDLDEREASMLFIALGNGIQEVALARHPRPSVDAVGDLGMTFLRGERPGP